MKKKVIITDLDGTAVDSPEQKLASARLKKVISSLEDRYYICAATGRSWTWAKDLLDDLQLKDPCIISGGAKICLPETGEIILQQNITPTALKQVVEVMLNYPDYMTLCNDYSEADFLHGNVTMRELSLPSEVYFFERVDVPELVALEIQAQLQKIPELSCILVKSQTYAGCVDIHTTHAQATKEHAIAVLLEKLALQRADAIGIGDGNNDLHLFAGVGYKVAMGNAVPALKQVADLVIDDVRQDGLAKYLESLL